MQPRKDAEGIALVDLVAVDQGTEQTDPASGEAIFPAAVRDVKQAVSFLRANSSRWGLDPGFFAAWGRSAGGYLSAMLGVTTGQHTMFDVDESAASGVHAVVDWYGPSDFLLMDLQFREGPPQGRVHRSWSTTTQTLQSPGFSVRPFKGCPS